MLKESKLTNKVLLSSSYFEGGKTYDTGGNCKGTECECDGDASGTLENALGKKNQRYGIDNQVTGQVEREIQNKWFRCIEHGASALLLRPLYGDIFAAEKGIVEQYSQIAGYHEYGHGPEHLSHRWSSF